MNFISTLRHATAPVALSLTGGMLLAGCSSPTTSTEKVDTVTIRSGQAAQNGPLLKSIFDAYNKSAGSTAVDLQMNADTDVDTAQKVLVDIAAGAAPDAVRVTSATYQTLIDSGAAQSADTCLTSDKSLEANLNKKLIDDIRVDGKAYQIPWYVTPNALFYNPDLFRKAGLNPDTPPKTMDDFHAAAKAIAATGTGGGVAYFGNDFNFQSYVASLGGSVYDPSTAKLGIDTDAGKAVFEAFGKMTADGSSPTLTSFFPAANEAFAGGKLGMLVTSSSAYPSLVAAGLNVKIAPVPYMTGGKATATTSTNGFVITTKDPARQKAVCAALLTLLSPQSVTETVKATATIPLLTSTITDPAYLAPVYAQHPDWVGVRDQNMVPWRSLPGKASAEFTKAYVDTQLKVLRGDITGDQAATQLQSAGTKLLEAK